ncbi:MAG: dTDP-4-dehydrorhamnose 3,5-epimerase family protein [Microthrixaceae bacterium]
MTDDESEPMAEITESELIKGVYVVRPRVFGDERGYFVETYRREWIPSGREMIQGNRGNRVAGCLVGLHYHLHQADYWYVPFGHARVVLHDLRRGSETDGNTQMIDLGEVDGGDNEHLGVYIPPGVAHGFSSITDMAITYLVDGYYNPADELGVAWDDPDIAADWGLDAEPILSERDRSNPRRADIEAMWQPHVSLRT